MEKINYFEHEIKVKYNDAILAQQQDWNWLVEYIELNFNLEDIQSWEEFQTQNSILSDIIIVFTRIVEIKDHKLNANNVYLLAGHFVGKK